MGLNFFPTCKHLSSLKGLHAHYLVEITVHPNMRSHEMDTYCSRTPIQINLKISGLKFHNNKTK